MPELRLDVLAWRDSGLQTGTGGGGQPGLQGRDLALEPARRGGSLRVATGVGPSHVGS